MRGRDEEVRTVDVFGDVKAAEEHDGGLAAVASERLERGVRRQPRTEDGEVSGASEWPKERLTLCARRRRRRSRQSGRSSSRR